jgi:anti-anti-sigma factor
MKLTLLPLQKDNVLRARCDGPVSRREMDDPLQALLGPHCYSHKVLLSLERAQSIDTSGISWLLQCQERFHESGGNLVLYGVPPVVIDVLNFLRLTPRLAIAPTEEAACEQALQTTSGTGRSSDGSVNAARRLPPGSSNLR